MTRKKRKLAGDAKSLREKDTKMRQVQKGQKQQAKAANKQQTVIKERKIERDRRRKMLNQAGGELSAADAPRLQCLDLPRVSASISFLVLPSSLS